MKVSNKLSARSRRYVATNKINRRICNILKQEVTNVINNSIIKQLKALNP